MSKLYPAVADYLSVHREQIVADLMELVRYPSISKAGKDGLPFGKEVDDVLNAAAAMFQRNGIPMSVRHEGGYAAGGWDGIGDGIGIFGHADVVPVNDDWVKTSPFEPVEENGFLYGRGISDNKAGVIASLYALLALKAAGVELKSRIAVYVGGSEETGMQDMDNYVRNERMPAVCLVPDSGFPMSVGEKGILRVNCISRKPLRDVKKLDGGKAYNVILDKVDVELANGEAFVVKGLTSHASHPEGSINAAQKAAEQLLEMPICDGDKAILEGMRTVISDYYGGTVDIASTGVFGNLTSANGIARVEEDGRLYFTLDIRYGSETTSEKMIPVMAAALDRLGYDMEVQEDDPGFLLDENGREMEIVLNTCRECAGKPEAEAFKMGGGTYARKLRNAFAISHSLPVVEEKPDLPAGHGGAHQSDEVLNVENLLGGIWAIACMIAGLDAHLAQGE